MGGHRGPSYLHLFDGGVNDNLGIQALSELYTKIAHQDVKRNGRPRGCFIFLIDAELIGSPKSELAAWTTSRRHGGFLIDANAMRASDLLFARAQVSMRMAHNLEDRVNSAITKFLREEFGRELRPESPICYVWHISLARVTNLILNSYTPETRERYLIDGWPAVDQVPTRFTLTGPNDLSSRQVQDFLFDAADKAIWEDTDRPILLTCSWFLHHGLASDVCKKQLSGTGIDRSKTYAMEVSKVDQAEDFGAGTRWYADWAKLISPAWSRYESSDEPERGEVIFLNEKAGASIRIADVEIDVSRKLPNGLLRPPMTKDRSPFTFATENDPVDRARRFLNEIVNKFARWGSPGNKYPLAIRHFRSEGQRTYGYTVLMRSPLDELKVETTEIQYELRKGKFLPTEKYYTAALLAKPLDVGEESLRVKIYMSSPIRKENDKWRALLASMTAPTTLSDAISEDLQRSFDAAFKEIHLQWILENAN